MHFQHLIWDYYREHGRMFPWRQTRDPYHILVSEIMLQQTPTSRVLQKYDGFIGSFPDFSALAGVPLREILHAWQGLGYNRRALALKEIARTVLTDFNGELPSSPHNLAKLHGIGRCSASAIAALAFNQPTVFVETNIRAVFLYFFFRNEIEVSDREILPLVEATMDKTHPREWYYALFDYGAMLKKSVRLGLQSRHYRKQGPFKGSDREMRGRILRILLARPSITEGELIGELEGSPMHVRNNVRELQNEGFMTIIGNRIFIK
jgi:A/G-specific adenine glycosylase